MSQVILVGANPGIRLYADPDATPAEEPYAFASVWQVDWSIHGSGTALVLWHDGHVRVLGDDPVLARWLAHDFTRHFPEVGGLPWETPEVEPVTVGISVDMASGLIATGGDVAVHMAGVLDRRVYATDSFALDGVPHRLSLVYQPMETGRVEIGGVPLPALPRVESLNSTAFMATAEVWSR